MVIAGSAASYFQTYATGRLGAFVLKDIRDKMMQNIGRMSFASFSKNHSGDIVSRLNNETWSIRNFIQSQLINIIFLPIMFLCAFSYMLLINWKLTIVSFVLVPIVIYITNIISQKNSVYSKNYFCKLGSANSIIQDSIKGFNILKSFNLEKYLYDKCKNNLDEALGFGLEIEKRLSYILPLIIIMYELPFIMCVLYGGYLSINGEISSADLVAFIQLLTYVIQPLVNIPQMIANVRKMTGAVERLSEIQQIEIERSDGKEYDGDINACDRVIEFKNVSFQYENDVKVLNEVSFCIQRGQKVGIVGESGSGKSTILNLICGFYEASGGQIRIFGEDVMEWKLDSLREKIAYAMQDAHIYSDSVFENIRYGSLEASKEEVLCSAKAANANEFISKMSHGYDTIIGEGGVKISGGERQRIAIARTMLKKAPIILLDESTSAQDYHSESLIIEALNKLNTQQTLVVVAHRLWTLRNFDKILVLKDGSIIEIGTHDQLIEKRGQYYSLYTKYYEKMSQQVGGTEYENT